MNNDGKSMDLVCASPRITPALDFPVVGIGASAGGLEALSSLLKDAPEPLDMALVLIQHLDPQRPSLLTQLLQKSCRHPIYDIVDGMLIEKGRVYVLPPGKDVRCDGPRLRLTGRSVTEGLHKPIDTFFESLAQTQGAKAVGIILSGTGNDGCQGIAAIKAGEGFVLAQDPETAKFAQMPREALATGYVDQLLRTDRMASAWPSMASYVSHEVCDAVIAPKDLDATLPTHLYEPILSFLGRRFRVDFQLYKSSTLKRRILRRMSLRKQDNAQSYLELLQQDSKEAQDLYDDLLIHVTSFFRDSEVFTFLQDKVLPDLIKKHKDQDPLRIWVAGCSTGEEVYSLAILFDEFMERTGHRFPLQIFASDVSDKVIEKARLGFFTANHVEGLSADRLQRYFHAVDNGYQIAKSLRDMCVFAVHNLAGDPPFSRMDFVSCRNVLIYLSPLLQKRIIPTFHFALKPKGVLLLGSAESIGPFEHLFSMLDKSFKVFQKLEAKSRAIPMLNRDLTIEAKAADIQMPFSKVEYRTSSDTIRDAERLLLNRYGPCALILDDKLQIIAIYGESGPYLKLPNGPLTAHLSKLAREDLVDPIRTLANKAKISQQPESHSFRTQAPGERSEMIRLDAHPLRSGDQLSLYLLLVIQKPSVQGKTHGDFGERLAVSLRSLWGSRRQDQQSLEALQRELQWSKESLRLLEENLEAKIQDQALINEDLKAASEEILSSNEELQSTNEELETSKEELQSTVEELNTVNEQLTNRNTELMILNSDLTNLLNNANIPLLIVSKNLTIRRFTSAAAKLFRLIPEDVGRRLSDINLHLIDVAIESRVNEVMEHLRTGEWEVQGDDGSWYGLCIKPYRTLDDKIDGAVLTLIDIDLVKRSKNYAQAIVDTLHQPLTILNYRLEVVAANEAFAQLFGSSARELEGQQLTAVIPELKGQTEFQELLATIIPNDVKITDFPLAIKGRQESSHILTANASRISVGQPKIDKILLSLEDMTVQAEAEGIRAQWSMIFEKSEMAIVLVEQSSDRISLANQAFADLYDIPKDQLMGRELADLFAPEARTHELQRLQQLEAEAGVEYESWHISRTGRVFPVFVRAQLIRDSQNNPLCRMFYIVDSTKSRQVDDEKAKASRVLEEATLAKSNFIANVSHEIRTPLAAILGYTEILASHRNGSISHEECLARIHRNILNVTEIIDEVLDLSKVEAGKMEVQHLRFALRPELDEVLALFQGQVIEKGLDLSCQVSAEVPETIKSDPNRLRQILINVLGNAIKFTQKGSVQLTVHSTQLPGQAGERRLIVFRIQDTGIGVSLDQQSLLFKPFSQADSSITRRFGGTGLGLTLSRSLARLLGGDLVLTQSELGTGSVFECSIEDYAPKVPQESIPPETSAAQSLPALAQVDQLKGLRILLVEDAPDLQAIYGFLLESFGATLLTASNGLEAITKLEKESCDLVLMDLQMPIMDGYEATKALRARGFKTPIIALTAHAMPEERERIRDAHFDDFLTKPIHGDDLLQGILKRVSVPELSPQ